MKEGWTYKKLGEVATFMSGYTPDKSELFPQGKYPYFKVAEMNNPGNELFMRNTSLYIDSPKKVFPKGSIIFPKNGGAIYTEKKRILEYDSVIDLNSEAISPNGQIVLKYLFCFLNHIKISSFDKGGGLPSLDLKKMANSLIPLPSLSEQQRIVSRLDSAFAHIDELKANAEKQLSEARTLFQKALTKAMEPKEGWDEKTLNSIVKSNEVGIVRGLKEQDISYEYPYIKMGNITQFNKLDLTDIVFINATAEEVKKYQLIKGDFLFNTRNSKELVGKSCLFNEEGLYLYNNNILRIRFNNGIDSSFINYLFSADLVKKQLDKIKKGTTNVWAIYYRELKDILLQIPPLSEQQRIVSRLDSLSAHVRELEEVTEKTIAECDALKQALLRKVFE